MTPNQRRAQQRVATKKAISTFWSRAERGRAELKAAEAILEDPGKYQGEQAAVVIWARMTVRRQEESA